MAELLHALIIEDSDSDAELLRLQLERDGYTLKSQRVDTLEGVKTALRKPGWEIVISDYNLPGFDASTVLTLLKESGEDIPFIIVSGKIEEETAVELMRNGATDYIMKDKLARLAPAVRRELRDSQIRRERRDTEIALVESNRRFQTLFEQSPFGVILFDIATTLPVEFNSIAHRQLGYTREEFAHLRICDYELIESDRAIKQRIAAILQSGSDRFETQHRAKTGEVRNIQVTAKPIFLSEGVLLHCVFQDITNVKKAERALDESQSAFADIFESVNEGIAYTNLSGEVIAVNQRLIELINIPRSDMVGRNILTIAQKILSAKDVVNVLPKLMSMIKGKQVEPFDVEYKGKVFEVSSIYNQKSNHITGVVRDITERKRAESILKENEARFRMMYESTPVGYQSLDKEGRFLDVNPAWLKMLGFTRDEVIGKWFGDLLIPEQQFLFMERFPCFVKEGEVRDVEFDMVHKDGHVITVSFDGLIGHTPEGKFRQTHCMMKDITKNKKATEAIATHLSLLNSMVSNISDVIAIMQVDGTMTYKSPNIEKWFGWKPEDLIGTKCWDTVHPEDLERVQAAFSRLLEADGKTDSIEYCYKCKDGSYRLIKLTATNLVNDPVINGVLMNYHDITERRQLENESAAISEKFRKAFVTSPDSININRMHDGLYIEVNDGFLGLTGYSREEVIGKTSLELDIWVYPEDRERLVNGLRAEGKVINLETSFRAKDGTIRTYLMSANIIEVDGETCILSITRDISDRKKAEEAIRLQSVALNTAANGIVITDAEDRITWVNPAFSDLSGYSFEEAIGNRVSDLVRSNVHDAEFYQAIDRIVKSGKVWHGEIINRRKDGQLYTEDLTVSPLLSPDGTITNFVSVRQNITERKKAEEAIRLQSAALHAAANAISITDADNIITWVNQAFTNMTGYTWQECMGRKLEDLIRSDAHPREVYADINETISNGRVWQGEIINRRKNGELFAEDMTVTPVFGDDGRIISYISIKQEITERKKMGEVMAARLHLLEYANDHVLEDVLQETLAEAEKLTDSYIGFYHFLKDDEQSIYLQAWSKPTLGSCAVDIQDKHYSIDQAGVWVDCVRQRKPVIHNNYASLSHRKGMPAGHAPVIRELVVPVFRGERIVAVLGVGNKASDYTEADIEQISRLADLAWDIAEKKISEQARQKSETRYHDLFENSPVPTLVEDFSGVLSIFTELRQQGVKDFREYINAHPKIIQQCVDTVVILESNNTSVDFFGLVSKEELSIKLPTYFADSSWKVFQEEIISLAEGKTRFTSDMEALTKCGEKKVISLQIFVSPESRETLDRVLVSFIDITERRRAEERNRAEIDLLQICNNAGSGQELLHNLLGFFKEFTGCEAVGIRLHENGDFPYFETTGFPDTFVDMENSLCALDSGGRILRDEVGNPVLECMCGNILRGRFDPSKPFFTRRGSFWSGNTSQLLASTSEADHQACTRNRCNGEGYESVALIPIKVQDKTFGLFQFNDSRVGVHTLEKIEMLEKMVDYVAIALAKQEADTALAESEQNFREIFNSTSEAIFIDDAETGRMIDVNETMLKMYGFNSKDEVLAGNIGDLSTEQPAYSEENVQERIRRAIEEGPQTFEWLGKRRDGSTFWSEVSLTRSLIGGKNRVLAVMRDISERKKIEDTLNESEKRFKYFFDNSVHGKSITKINGEIHANRAFCEMLGFTQDELAGKTWQEITHPDDIEFNQNTIQKLITGKSETVRFTKRYLHKNGSIIWADIGTTLRRDQIGNPEYLITSISDITDTKRAEEKLRDSEERFRSYVENASDIVYSLDKNGVFTYISPTVLDLLGYVPEELTGKSFEVIIHPEDIPACREFLHKVFADSAKQSGLEFRVKHNNGSLVWYTTNASLITDENGKNISYLGIAYDINQRKEAEEALIIEKQKAQNYLDIAGVMLVAFGLDEKISLMNRRGCKILGYAEEELLGKNWFDTCLPERLKLDIKKVFEGVKAGQIKTFEYYENPVLTRSGEERMIGWHNAPILDEEGNVTGVISSGEDITERKLAEAALRDTQTLLAKSQEIAHVGSWELDPRSRRLNWTDEVYRIFGVAKEDFPGTLDAFMESVHPDDLERVNTRYFTSLIESELFEFEHRVIQRNSGNVLHVVEKGYHVRDENGEVVKSFGMVQDITDRKLYEAALRKSEALLNKTQLISKIGGWEWDIATQRMTWSDEVYRIHEISPLDIPNNSPELDQISQSCYHPDDRMKIDSLFEECKQTGKQYEVEARFSVKNGTEKWVLTNGVGYVENGNVVRVSGNIMDITERKKAEKKLRESEALLNEAQRLSKNGAWDWDIETQSMTWSDEVYRIHGFRKEDFPQGSTTAIDRSLACYDPQNQTILWQAFQDCAAYGKPYDLELRFTSIDGTAKWVRTMGNPVFEDGVVTRVMGNIMDVTESKTLELALQHSLEEQEVLLREVHHRVKNNLASILGLLEMERQTTTDPNADTLLMELGNRIKSMSTIHEKLYRSRSLSKIDFDGYLKSFVSHLRTSMQKGREIHTFVKAQGVELSLDAAVPCGLIINELVTNALKYAFPEGKPGVPDAEQCEISVSMSARGTAYTLTVSDNGVGLPPDMDWQNAKTLGLRLIHMLSEHQLGGTVTLDRRSGTSFTVKFNPVHREPSHE